MSIWLRDSEGLSEANMLLLEAAAVSLGTATGPWIVGGDWNISPQLLAQSGWLQMVQGTIVATTLPTCNASVYDYFVVHNSLSHAVVGVQRISDGGLNPHWPSRLLLRGDSRRLASRVLVKPPRVAARLPAGPSRCPQRYDDVARLAGELEIDLATELWLEKARYEWSDLAGADLRHRAPKFKWACPVGPIARRWHGASAAS
eukprot:2980076-Karenia_brevis.AAC.1